MNAQECMAKAESALLDAGLNIAALAKSVNEQSGRTPLGEVTAITREQINLGQAWRDLAALKSFETER